MLIRRHDSRGYKMAFAMRVDVQDPRVIDTSNKVDWTLSELLHRHPTFKVGHNGSPYFHEDRYVLPEDYTIPLWSQNPDAEQPFTEKEEVDNLVHQMALGWREYTHAVTFKGKGFLLELEEARGRDSLYLAFNGESHRIYSDFSNFMREYIRPAGFITNPPKMILAQREGVLPNNAGRREFLGAIERRFGNLKTNIVPVKQVVFYQMFFSNSDEGHVLRGQRDIAKIDSNGRVEMLFDGSPFNKSLNDELVNADKPAARGTVDKCTCVPV